MGNIMCSGEDVPKKGKSGRNVDVSVEQHKAIHHCPWCAKLAGSNLVVEGDQRRVGSGWRTDRVEEVEVWGG